jgi:hypothetical protein
VPSETVGRAVPRLLAFLAIQSRAARMLSSVPALSYARARGGAEAARRNPGRAVDRAARFAKLFFDLVDGGEAGVRRRRGGGGGFARAWR